MKIAGSKILIASAFVLVLAIAAVFFLSRGEKRKEGEKAAGQRKVEKAAPAASDYTLTITKEAQRTDGITTEALNPILYQKRVAAYGKVLPSDGLNASRKSYIAALAGLEKAEAALKASEKEYERMRVLNASAKNVSDRALQAAAAQLAADKAEEAHARGTLQSTKDAISLEWGPILSRWIFDYSAALRRLVETKDVLVQVTLSPAAPLQGLPKEVRIEAPDRGATSARFVSRATSTNPQIQGMSLIYVASSRSGSLVPGMNVRAQLPSARTQTGFFVSDSAVVWLQDRAWVYIKKSETGFSRMEVPTSNPVNEGYFVSGIFSPGDELVVKGAQALLSEESTPKATAGGGEDEDED